MSWLIEVNEPKTREEMISIAKAAKLRMAGNPQVKQTFFALPPPPVKRDFMFLATGTGQLRVRSTFSTPETDRQIQRCMRHAKRIAAWVARRHNLSADKFFSRSRSKPIVKPRQLAIQLIAHSRHCNGLSYPRLASMFGMDHSTILHAARLAPSFKPRKNYGQDKCK